MHDGSVMGRHLGIGALALAVWVGGLSAHSANASETGEHADVPPAWLYPVNGAQDTHPLPDPDTPRHVAESTQTYTNTQVDDLFIAPDWHPEDHQTAPAVVSNGRPPDTYACGYCHRITGSGAPENARLAGLSARYIRQQLEDFRSGVRRSSRPDRIPQAYMTIVAKSLTEAEIDAAANYFSAQPPAALTRVVESRTAPRVHVENWALTADRPIRQEVLGHRLLELPDDPLDFTSRDTRATFTIFAPLGSIARGRRLASGRGAAACTRCHGQRLQGQGVAPSLIGQSPSYLLRQLVDFGRGARHGPLAAAMAGVARSMSIDDMIAVTAYAASLAPQADASEVSR
jgi:cytochrome c553